MAFSMFLRSPVITNKLLAQQMMKFATQGSVAQRCVASPAPIHSIFTNDNKTTPITNAVRSFRTSATMRSSETPHDHAKLWVIEKAVTASLVPLIPLAIMLPCKIFDSAIAILITAHTFWGLEAIVVEYVRVLLFGSIIPKLAMLVVYFCTAIMLGGLYFQTFNDIGLCRGFWRIWKNMTRKSSKK